MALGARRRSSGPTGRASRPRWTWTPAPRRRSTTPTATACTRGSAAWPTCWPRSGGRDRGPTRRTPSPTAWSGGWSRASPRSATPRSSTVCRACVGALLVLDAPGADGGPSAASPRPLTVDGWPPAERSGPRTTVPSAGSTTPRWVPPRWCWRRCGRSATASRAPATLAARAADVLLAEAEPSRTDSTGDGLVPVPAHAPGAAAELVARPRGHRRRLALAGAELDRPELVEAARAGGRAPRHPRRRVGRRLHGAAVDPAGRPGAGRPAVLRLVPRPHRHLAAVPRAGPRGRAEVAGEPTTSWYARGRHSVRTSGLPDRLRPGFWDNDGRCCGTAGVGDAFLDAYARTGDDADLAFAVRLGDALVERAVVTGAYAYWRFLEHRDEHPLRPPGRRLDAGRGRDLRVPVPARPGRSRPVRTRRRCQRMENWWAVGDQDRVTRTSRLPVRRRCGKIR